MDRLRQTIVGGIRKMWLSHRVDAFEKIWIKSSKRKKVGLFLLIYTFLFSLIFISAYGILLKAGKSFILSTGDGRNQHYPVLIYVGRYLRQIVINLLHGKIEIPLFDLNLAMGGDIITTLNYYGFGHPLYLLAAFVPTVHIEALYNILGIFRMYLAGISFMCFERYYGKRISYALIGALVYICSGYVILSTVGHPYFVEPVIQLPLLIVGIDMVIQRKKPYLFIGMVFYSALCGFYFLYIMTIMLGFYALVRFFDVYFKERIKEFVCMMGRIIWTYLAGVGLGAPLFLPSLVGLFTSDRGTSKKVFNYFSYGLNYYRDNTLRFVAPGGSYEILFMAAVTLFALTIFVFFHRGQYRTLKVLLGICVMFYVLPLGGSIMNGFTYPSQRWAFGFSLLLSYIVVEMLPELLALSKKQELFCFCVVLYYGLCVFAGARNRTVNYVIGFAMLLVTLITLILFGHMRTISVLACLIVIIGNIGICGIYFFASDQGKLVNRYNVYGEETKRVMTAIEREGIPYAEKHEGRIDNWPVTWNLGPVWRVPTTSMYWSMVNENIVSFYQKLENIRQSDSAHTIKGTNSRTYMGALLSTKYFLLDESKKPYIPYGYSLVEQTSGGTLIYENQYALPWGYTFDSYMPETLMENKNGLEREETMLQSIVLEHDVDGIPVGEPMSTIRTLPYEITKFDNGEWNGGTLKVNKDSAKMILEFEAPVAAELYLRIEGLNIDNSGQSLFYINTKCEKVEESLAVSSNSYSWHYGREDYLVNLGYSEDKRTTCTITFPKKGTYKMEDIQLFALPMEKYSQRVEALREEPLENIVWETNKVSGTVDLSKNKILCMSIPYSKGWTAKVDGQKVEIMKGNYMFMALSLTAGHHDIEFTYCTPGLKVGIAASLFSAGVVIYLGYQEKRKRRVL